MPKEHRARCWTLKSPLQGAHLEVQGGTELRQSLDGNLSEDVSSPKLNGRLLGTGANTRDGMSSPVQMSKGSIMNCQSGTWEEL